MGRLEERIDKLAAPPHGNTLGNAPSHALGRHCTSGASVELGAPSRGNTLGNTWPETTAPSPAPAAATAAVAVAVGGAATATATATTTVCKINDGATTTATMHGASHRGATDMDDDIDVEVPAGLNFEAVANPTNNAA